MAREAQIRAKEVLKEPCGPSLPNTQPSLTNTTCGQVTAGFVYLLYIDIAQILVDIAPYLWWKHVKSWRSCSLSQGVSVRTDGIVTYPSCKLACFFLV